MRRIFWKILLSFWLALLLTGIGTAAIVTLYQDAKAVYSNLETGDRPNGITESIARTMLSGGKKLLQDIVKPQNLNINKDGTGGPPFPYVVDQQGKDVFERTINPKVLAEAQRITEHEANTPGVEKITLATGEVYWIFMQRKPPPFPHNIMFELFDTPVFLFLMIILTSLLFSNWLARSVSRPIETLRDGLKAVSQGNFDIHVSKKLGKRYDEFAELGRDTDSMAEKLKQLIDAQRRLLHDVSHDLRSPLARLQLHHRYPASAARSHLPRAAMVRAPLARRLQHHHYPASVARSHLPRAAMVRAPLARPWPAGLVDTMRCTSSVRQ